MHVENKMIQYNVEYFLKLCLKIVNISILIHVHIH